MATAREVLQLIITGDGRGAIAEMEKVGAASKRNLGETERSIGRMSGQLTSFGAVSVGAGTLAAAGLFRTAQAAGTLDMNVQRMRGNFGSAADQAIAFGKNYEYLSDIDATGALAQVGELATGLGVGQEAAAGFAQRAVDVVTQLALLKGVGAQDALHTINAALIGEYDSLQKLVPNISAAKIEQRALADSGKENAKALSDSERAMAALNIIIESGNATIARTGDVSETAAARQARLAAQWGDLKVRIGEEALPAMESAIDVASDAIGVFERVDDATGGWASRLAVVGTVGSLAAGGLALVVGGGMKAYDVFGDLNGRLRTTEGDLTRTGRAAQNLGIIAAGVAATAGIMEAINWGTGVDRRIEDEINSAIAAGENGEQALTDFVNAADEQMRRFGLMDSPKWLASELGILGQSMLKLPGSDFKRIMESDVQSALDNLRKRAPETALAVLNAWEMQNEALDHSSEEYRANKAFIDENRSSIETAAAATREMTGATQQQSSATRSASSSLDALAYSYERTADAAEGAKPGALAYAEAVRGAIDPVLGLMDANDRLRDAEERMAEAAATNGKDIRDASRAVADARERVTDATENLSDAQERLNELLNDDPLFGLKQVSPEQEMADARRRLAEANRDLAKNPLDPYALTKRDEALADLEDASERAQRIKREGEQRVKQIRDARRAVEDAQKGLVDAQDGVTDAQERLNEVQSEHGLNSKAYRDASRDVIRANLDVQDATAELAQFLRDNGVEAIGAINAQLDKWIALGGPTGSAAQQIKDQMQPLVVQALLYAAALKQINEQRAWMAGSIGLQIGGGWGYWQGDDAPPSYGAGRNLGGGGGSTGRNLGGKSIKSTKNPPTFGTFAGGGIDNNPWTPFATGGLAGLVGGSGIGDVVPGLLDPREFVMRPEAVRQHGLPLMYALNSGRPLTHRLAGAAVAAGGSSRPVEGDVTINANITQVVPRTDGAGEAVVSGLRGIAWRSGKGLRAGRVLEGRRP